MFTDVSSEMVTAVLPLYLAYEVRLTALQFGLFDGLTQGVQALVRIVSARIADRGGRHKVVAASGYALSATTRLALPAAAQSWTATGAVVVADRLGKGIRTAPRDALIAANSDPRQRGRAFGVHRAFDTAGALAGPLVAFAVLAATMDSYDSVFVVSFSFAIVGLAILVLFVPAGPRAERSAPTSRSPWSLRGPLLRMAIAATLLGATTISDAFLYLTYRQTDDFDLRFFPLLFTGTAAVYLLLAVPIGALSDRIGRRPVLLGGYGLLGAAYFSLVVPGGGALAPIPLVVLLGAYYAATDGVLAAMVSDLVAEDRRATGIAIVTTAIVVGRVASSVVFGAVWSTGGPEAALSWFITGLAVAVLISWRLLPGRSAAGSTA